MIIFNSLMRKLRCYNQFKGAIKVQTHFWVRNSEMNVQTGGKTRFLNFFYSERKLAEPPLDGIKTRIICIAIIHSLHRIFRYQITLKNML